MKNLIVRKNTPDWTKQTCTWCKRKRKLKFLTYVPRSRFYKKGFWACKDERYCFLKV